VCCRVFCSVFTCVAAWFVVCVPRVDDVLWRACVGGGRERDRVKKSTNVKEREREIEREVAKVRVRKSVRQTIMPRYVYTQVLIHI